jgi:cytochrome c oxidase subunit 2
VVSLAWETGNDQSVMPSSAALLIAGQNVLQPHSPAEHSITVLGWVMFVVASVGLLLVAGLLVLGWTRRRTAALPFGGDERAATRLVIGLGIGLPIVLLTALFVWSDIFVIRSTAAPRPGSTALTVQVIGHQWFWEIRYPGSDAVTADELHIPLRTRVNVVGTTADVIHSIWVPELNRKTDVVPGRTNRMLLYADRPGTYPGQCGEFCGLQHAHMELRVIAQPRDRFEQWLRRESAPARPSTGASSELGEATFASEGCDDCHQIRGTPAKGQVGPDLTHLASRTTLAGGTIPNDRTSLTDWLRDPQKVKPGNKMPDLGLSSAAIAALVAYLEALK